MNKTVGSAIREARKSCRMSAEKLGELLDPPVSHVAVCAWETGKNNPNVKTVMQISDILGVDVRKIFPEDQGCFDYGFENIPTSENAQKLCGFYEKMSEEQKAAILVVARSMID